MQMKDKLARYGQLLDVELGTQFVDNLTESKENADLLAQMLALAFMGRMEWTETTVKLTNMGKIYSARDVGEAANNLTPSATEYSVFSWRTYIKNFRDSFHLLFSGSDQQLQDELKKQPLQIRVLNLWIGDRKGQPIVTNTLKRLCSAQAQLEDQLREGFINLDNRPQAITKLKQTAGYIDALPEERLILSLEIAGESIKPLLKMDLLWQLCGKTTVAVNDLSRFPQSKEIFSADLTGKIGQMCLGKLPQRLDQAYKLFH